MRSIGAPSGNHRHMPPLPTHSPSLPPPPPPVPPPLPNSSSSSTLSAWAPPFTFDHVFPAPPPPAHHPSVPPQALLVSDRPSSSRLPSHNSAAVSLRSQPRTGALGVGDPYYAHYYPSSQLRALDDSFGPSSAFSELGPGPWNKPFDEEVGHAKLSDTAPTWRESPFSYTAPSFQEELVADGNVYSDKDSYGVWNGKFADSTTGKKKYFGSQHSEWLQDNHPENYEQDMGSSYSIFNAPISTPSALLNGIHRSATIGSTSRIGSHDISVSNSTYNRYMAQLDSCSADPLIFHPSATSSTSIEVHGLSNLKTSTNINSTLSPAKVHHAGSYKIKGPSVVVSSSKEVNLNQNLSSKGGYDAKICIDHSTNSFMPPVVSGEYPPSSNNQATESLLNLSSMLSSESRLGNIVIADASSRSRSLEPDNSIKSSSEAVDQHNLAVDSPCWKGAPSSRQSPFSVNEMLAAEIKDSNKNDPCVYQKTILEGIGNSKQSAEQVGNLNFGEIEKSYLSERPDPEDSAVASSSIQQKTEGAYKKLSNYIKHHENEILSDTACGQQINATIEAEKRDEAQNISDAKSVETESNTGHEFPQAKGIVDNIKDSCSARQKSIKDLVKSIHSYSVELLSTNFNDREELEAHDCRLLYSAISNIKLLLKDKKDLVGFNHCSCLEPAGSCNISENTRLKEKNHNCNMKGKTISVGCNCLNDEFNNFVIKCSDADLKKVNSNTQIFENALSETFCEREENEGTLFYKNLWIQAEVMTCRLKQKLLLAQMKMESENSKPPRSDISSSLPSQTNHEEHNLPSKLKDMESIRKRESLPGGSANCQLKQADDMESSAMARFKILKDRMRNISSTSRRMEEDCILDLQEFAMHSGANTNIGDSPDTENDSDMYDLPINLTDLGFMEPVAEAPISWSFFRAIPHTQPLSATTDEADGTSNGNARQMAPGPLYGSLIQSYMTSKEGSWPSTRHVWFGIILDNLGYPSKVIKDNLVWVNKNFKTKLSDVEVYEFVFALPSSSLEAIESASIESIGPVAGACVEALGASPSELKRATATGIQLLTKHRSDFRALIGASRFIPVLVPLLKSIDPAMQESAVTALLNLLLEEENKKPIIIAGAKQNAACALLNLSMIEENRGTIGACGAILSLVSLLVSGSSREKKDSLTTLYKLCLVRLNKERAISAGAVPPLVGLVGERSGGTAEKALVVLGSLATVPEGKDAVAEAGGIPVLVEAMETGPTAGGEFTVHELLQLAAESPHIQRLLLGEGAIPPLVELSQAGSSRAKRKVCPWLTFCSSFLNFLLTTQSSACFFMQFLRWQ
ncbi:uncharacterized protein LOC122033756 [Zingiber officinale]|uniref:uncharacterized protein LOC122033756 n=1 Tax=Zingiber officinale TaxID=94328 RepID=UPI001C4D5FCE|nr:uncharacterized protein LOC122033756 [Zingiber officinale]